MRVNSTHTGAEASTSDAPSAAPAIHQWESVKSLLERLYIIQDLPLKEVRAVMASLYSFNATESMYKTRFRKWGFEKNVKASEMEAVIDLADSNANLAFETRQPGIDFKGKSISRAKIERYMRRHNRERQRSFPGPYSGFDPSSSPGAYSNPSSFASSDASLVSQSPWYSVQNTGYSPRSPQQNWQGGYRTTSDSEPQFWTDAPFSLSPKQSIDNYKNPTSSPPIDVQTPVCLAQPPGSPPPFVQIGSPDITQPCPARPKTKTRRPRKPWQRAIWEESVLIALLLTALDRGSESPQFLKDPCSNIEAKNFVFDNDILKKAISVLAWLQLPHVIVMVAIRYLVCFAEAQMVFSRDSIWTHLIVALKFAQVMYDDHPFGELIWLTVLWDCDSIGSTNLRKFENRILTSQHVNLVLNPKELDQSILCWDQAMAVVFVGFDIGRFGSIVATDVSQQRQDFELRDNGKTPLNAAVNIETECSGMVDERDGIIDTTRPETLDMGKENAERNKRDQDLFSTIFDWQQYTESLDDAAETQGGDTDMTD